MIKARKKVCIISTVHRVFDVRIFQKQAKSLVENGFEVILIGNNEKDEVVNQIQIRSVKIFYNRASRFLFSSLIALKRAIYEHAEIYHFHDPELLWIGFLLKIFTRSKVIYDCHEFYSDLILDKEWVPKGIRRIVAKCFSLCERVISLKLDAVVGVIDEQARLFKKQKFVALYNFPAKDYFLNLKFSFDKEFDLVYTGALSRDRGLFEMLKIVADLKHFCRRGNVKFALAGQFANEKIKKEFFSFLSQHNLQENVSLFGELPYEKALELVSKSRLGFNLALKNKNYGDNRPVLATKIFEYMALKVPFIMTNFKASMAFLMPAEYIFFCQNGKERDAAIFINGLLNKPKSLELLGKLGFEDFKAKYNWENEAEKLVNLYRMLLKIC